MGVWWNYNFFNFGANTTQYVFNTFIKRPTQNRYNLWLLTLLNKSCFFLFSRFVIDCNCVTGKSATARLFTQQLNGTYLRSPPDYLANIRGPMSMRSRLVRSAYHALNNYLMAELVRSIVKDRLVIMDQ